MPVEPLNLTPEQLEAYTGKSRPKAQARVLEAIGVPYRRRPDGSLIVLRIHVDYETTEKESASPALRLS
jgi:hypothetical protein